MTRAYNLDETIQRLRYRNGYDKPLAWMKMGEVYKVEHVYLGNVFDSAVPAWLGAVSFLGAAFATAVVLRRADRSPAGFCAAIGFIEGNTRGGCPVDCRQNDNTASNCSLACDS